MTIDEKSRVLKLKGNGLGYKAISKKLNLPINTVKSILRRETNAKVCKCKHCGKELKVANAYTSCEIHEQTYGLGYMVCEECSNEEWERRRKYRDD